VNEVFLSAGTQGLIPHTTLNFAPFVPYVFALDHPASRLFSVPLFHPLTFSGLRVETFLPSTPSYPGVSWPQRLRFGFFSAAFFWEPVVVPLGCPRATLIPIFTPRSFGFRFLRALNFLRLWLGKFYRPCHPTPPLRTLPLLFSRSECFPRLPRPKDPPSNPSRRFGKSHTCQIAWLSLQRGC